MAKKPYEPTQTDEISDVLSSSQDIYTAPEKATLNDNDRSPIADSEEGNKLKHVKTGTTKAGFKAYFDTLYAALTHTHSPTVQSPTATNDFLVGTQIATVWTWTKKTLAETITILRTSLDSIFAPIAKGVTNGDSHDHNGGDGGTVAHTALASIGSNTHAQIDTHLASTSNPHTVTAAQAAAIPNDGWIADSNTWTYSSADAPTYVISINADMTAKLQAGMRIKLTHSAAVKYFIVTAVGSFSAGATLVTVYGGTDYRLTNSALSATYYSPVKAPLGFPVDPDKWTVEVTDTTLRTQATPTQNVWYNNGSISISIPIGKWLVMYEAELESQKDTSSSSVVSVFVTLSTANNTESDKKWTGIQQRIDGATTSQIQVYGFVHRENQITLASKATYYLNEMTNQTTCANFYFRGDVATIVVRARCAYL